MMKMVRRHLERKYVVQEEELLERIAESTERGSNMTVLCFREQCYHSVFVVVQLRRNPPSPLNKGKRKSGHHDKHSKPHPPDNVTVCLCAPHCCYREQSFLHHLSLTNCQLHRIR